MRRIFSTILLVAIAMTCAAQTNRINVNTQLQAKPVSDTGAVNAYAVSLNAMGAAYFTGMPVVFTPANTNTGASTINVNSLGTKTIKKQGGTADVAAGDIQSGAVILLVYDGTNFQMLSSLGNGSSGSSFNGTNSQTANYTAVSGDNAKLISMNGSSLTLTLPASPPSSTWVIFVENRNSTALTVSRNGLNIDGAAANLTVAQNQGVVIFTDGSNYFTEQGNGLGLGVTLDTDGTLAANSDSRVASQKAVKTFVDTFAPGGSGSLVLQTKGTLNSSQGLLNLTTNPTNDIAESAGTVTIQIPFAWGGDAADGAITFDGTSTVLGLVPSSSTYTLTRDIFCSNITINGGVTVKSNNWAIFATGTVTVNGSIQNNGTSAGGTVGTGAGGNGAGSTGGSGGSSLANGGGGNAHYSRILNSGLAGQAGGNGSTTAGSQGTAGSTGSTFQRAPSTSVASVAGSSGAAGGAGGSGSSGAGGAARTGGAGGGATSAAVFPGQHPANALVGVFFNNGTTVSQYGMQNGEDGSGPGGGGGGGDGTNAGGGGGGSGAEGGPCGIVGIFAKSIVVGATGSIQCNGGSGGAGGNGVSTSAGNTGGGGGGAGGSGGMGGIIWLVYASLTNNGTIQAIGGSGGTGGALGTGHGTGTNGTAGANGPSGPAGIVISIQN